MTMNIFEEGRIKWLTRKYDFHGYKRIYLVHIRKTGGTSLNNMFLSLSKEDSTLLYDELASIPGHRLIKNKLIYVGWNAKIINKGAFFYAFSHVPFHKLNLPEKTFTLSCFRDPVKRLLSHYNMLMGYKVNNIDHPGMESQEGWLGNGLNDFLDRIPKKYLLNQIYMFSKTFNINEAVLNVKTLSLYFFSDEFDEGINDLNRLTGLDLEPLHYRKSNYKANITEGELARLKEMLEPEYNFINILRDSKREA